MFNEVLWFRKGERFRSRCAVPQCDKIHSNVTSKIEIFGAGRDTIHDDVGKFVMSL
jgi:hypothetical protein